MCSCERVCAIVRVTVCACERLCVRAFVCASVCARENMCVRASVFLPRLSFFFSSISELGDLFVNQNLKKRKRRKIKKEENKRVFL